MAIVQQLPSGPPAPIRLRMACKISCQGALPSPTETETNDVCICDFISCEYEEKVFAHSSGDFWKNDKSEFLFKRIVAVDTVAITLEKDGVKVADLNDNTLGTFFNGFASGSDEQQLYVGFLVDWNLVESAHGVGSYQVKADLSILGSSSTFESRIFQLCIYSDRSANGTVRIETTQNGNIIGSNFDFTDLEWYGSVRIPGVFVQDEYTFEESRYTTSTGRKIKQIKDKLGKEYQLRTKMIPFEVGEALVCNKMLANEILITDYQITNETIWRRVGVFPKDAPEKIGNIDNPNRIYNIKFVTNKDILIKRNF